MDYWLWAMKKNANNDTLMNVSKFVSAIIRYAYSQQYVMDVPPNLLPPVSRDDNQRGHYTRDQITKVIIPHLTDWAEKGAKKNSQIARLILKNFVLFSVYSGIRMGTGLSLKWKDIELPSILKLDDGKTIVRLGDIEMEFDGLDWLQYMADNIGELEITFINTQKAVGKKKGSWVSVVPMYELTEILKDFKKLTPYNKPNDYVFPNADGTQRKSDSLGRFHRKVIGGLGDDFKTDKFGLALSSYSWRHSYATWMLIHSNVSIERVALNMDTSLKQLRDHYSHATSRDFAIALSGWATKRNL